MPAEEEEFLERRVPRRSCETDGDCHGIIRPSRTNQEADGPGRVGEIALRFVSGRKVGLLNAGAKLKRQVGPGQLFVEERAEARLIDRRRQRLRALGVERAVQHGAPGAAFEAAIRPVRREHVDVSRVVLELRSDHVALELVMLVSPNGKRRPQRLEDPVH